MPIILSNRLKAMQDAAENFGDSVVGIRAAQKKAAQQALEEQRAAAGEQRAQEAHTVTMGRQKTAAGLEGMQFGQAKAQEAAGAEARGMASELEGFGQTVPDQAITLPGFAAQASGPSAVVTDAGEGLKDRLRASMHNAGLRSEGKNTGFVSADDVKKNRVQTAADLEMKKKKDTADLAGTEATTKAKLLDAKKTDAEIKKLDAETAKLASGAPDPEKAFQIESNLRNGFMQQTTGYQKVRDAYSKLQVAEPTAAGDMSLVYGYMTILDPGSSVKEGEFATAENAGGVQDKIRNIYNAALNGTRLQPGQREQFKSQAGKIFDSQKKIYDNTVSAFTNIASKYQVDPSRVIVDLSGGVSNAPAAPAAGQPVQVASKAERDALPPGTAYIGPDGQKAIKR